MFGVIGTCRWDVTDDKTLVISPLEGEEGVLVESVWPWQESDIRKVELIGKIVAPEHMTYMFYNCHMLEDAGSLKNLDVSRVYNIGCLPAAVCSKISLFLKIGIQAE